MLDSLRWRLAGPHRGGRVVAVAGHTDHRLRYYFGGCAGGVWQTDDAGITWRNITDGQFTSAAVGALEVAPSDPNVIYAGTGEACIRGNVIAGDGVYRTTDAGRTWRHLGLVDTRHISRVRVHPTDPDTVYVGAFGHAFGPNANRGVFRSRDGGRTWDKVLFRDERTGCADLRIDPANPRRLYAALWQAQRYPYKLESGGPGSGLFRSEDGGDTWTEITRRPGLPQKSVLGRMGVTVGARPGRLWALIEAEDGGLYRSEDYGETWRLLSDDPEIRARPFYYTHVFGDPQDADTVYVLALRMLRSTDGGATFTQIPTPHGDNHDLWIDPRDPSRMVEGNDGGACVSMDGGRTWSSIYNQPTAQFYHVTTDSRFPYRIYGAQQDNTTLCVPSRTDEAGIAPRETYDVGGAESGWIAVRDDNPDIVFAGSSGGGEGGRITRYDHHLRQIRDVSPWPQRTAGRAASEYKYRFQWTAPIVLSPHDPNVLYVCGNRAFKSTDDGVSWELISPDLTRDDPTKQGPSGGPITLDHTGVEVYCTIFAFAESTLRRGLLWAGSDDGLIHVSEDAGRTWSNVTPPASLLPEWALILTVEPSPHDPATCYVAATRYKWDDTAPYLLKTSDYGKTWTRIDAGVPDFTRVIREDPVKKGLLYLGTESGVLVSRDDGAHWESLQGNLPLVPIHDLVVKGDDLVVGTHGRGFWVLDDVTPLRQEAPKGPVHLFLPRPTVRFRLGSRYAGEMNVEVPAVVMLSRAGGNGYLVKKGEHGESPEFLDAGTNPPAGVIFQYVRPAGEAKLVIKDSRGELVRTLENIPPSRVVWNLRYDDAEPLDESSPRDLRGNVSPWAPPGRYTAELTAGGVTVAQPFEVRKDPRIPATQADLEEQLALSLRIRDSLSQAHRAVKQIRAARTQVDAAVARSPQAAEQAEALKAALTAVEQEITQVTRGKNTRAWGFQPKVTDELVHLAEVVSSADAAPTKPSYALFDEVRETLAQQLDRLEGVLGREVAAFNAALREVPAIKI